MTVGRGVPGTGDVTVGRGVAGAGHGSVGSGVAGAVGSAVPGAGVGMVRGQGVMAVAAAVVHASSHRLRREQSYNFTQNFPGVMHSAISALGCDYACIAYSILPRF